MGAYGGLVYLTSVFGAWVADRILPAERTLFYTAILVMFGHISLAIIPGVVGVIIGLIAVAVGSGTVKTTSQVILGSLYSRGDQRRDGGFSIYYMGVNLGALIGPLICNALWGWQGFHWGFGAAAVMMDIGLIQYSVSRRRTIGTTDQRVTNPLPTNLYLPIFGIGTVGVIAVVLLFATGILAVGRLTDFAALVALVTAVIMWSTCTGHRWCRRRNGHDWSGSSRCSWPRSSSGHCSSSRAPSSRSTRTNASTAQFSGSSFPLASSSRSIR